TLSSRTSADPVGRQKSAMITSAGLRSLYSRAASGLEKKLKFNPSSGADKRSRWSQISEPFGVTTRIWRWRIIFIVWKEDMFVITAFIFDTSSAPPKSAHLRNYSR